MAGESVVGALRVVLGLDTVSFEDGLDKSGAMISKFGDVFTKALPIAAIAGGLAAITAGILKTSESMDELGRTAQKVGMTTEQFSALNFAANLANVHTDQLATSMEKLARNMSAVAGGAKGPASDAFRAIGISVQDANGHLKDETVVLGQIADKFQGYRDGAAKTALAIALFGRAGAEMIPLLNEGSEGIAKSTEEAKKYGVVVSDEAAKASREFNDDLKRLSAVLQGVMVQAVSNVAAQMTALSKALLDSLANSEGLHAVVLVLTTAFNVFLGVLNMMVIGLDGFVKNLVTAYNAGKALVTGDWAKIPGLMKEFADNTVHAEQALLNAGKAMFGFGQASAFAGNAIGNSGMFESIKKAEAPILATKTALDKFLESQRKVIAGQQAEAAGIGAVTGTREALRVQLEAETIAKENNIKITDRMRTQIAGVAQDAATMAQRLKAAQLTQEFLAPWDLYLQKLRDIDIQFSKNLISEETYRKASTAAAMDMEIAYASSMSNTLGNAAAGFKTLAEMNHSYAGAAKAAAIGAAIANAYLAGVNVLAHDPFPWPMPLIDAGIAVAAGLANVAKIAATSFATGGSFRVGGGMGGTDTQMVAMALTPGEMVDVRKPGNNSGSSNMEITLRGMAPDDIFTGRWIRSFFDALNQGQRDGYKLKVV